jgi:hypothetical protein
LNFDCFSLPFLHVGSRGKDEERDDA